MELEDRGRGMRCCGQTDRAPHADGSPRYRPARARPRRRRAAPGARRRPRAQGGAGHGRVERAAAQPVPGGEPRRLRLGERVRPPHPPLEARRPPARPGHPPTSVGQHASPRWRRRRAASSPGGGLVDVEAEADRDPCECRALPARLAQDAAHLPLADHEVVRPLESRRDASAPRSSSRSATARPARRLSTSRPALAGRASTLSQSPPRRRRPGPPAGSPPRRLHLRHDRRARGRAALRQLVQRSMVEATAATRTISGDATLTGAAAGAGAPSAIRYQANAAKLCRDT